MAFKFKRLTTSHKRMHYDHSNVKGKLTYRQREKLPSWQFAIPEKREYPIQNANHARNALARVSAFGTPKEKKQVCNAVEKRYPEIHAESCMMHG